MSRLRCFQLGTSSCLFRTSQLSYIFTMQLVSCAHDGAGNSIGTGYMSRCLRHDQCLSLSAMVILMHGTACGRCTLCRLLLSVNCVQSLTLIGHLLLQLSLFYQHLLHLLAFLRQLMLQLLLLLLPLCLCSSGSCCSRGGLGRRLCRRRGSRLCGVSLGNLCPGFRCQCGLFGLDYLSLCHLGQVVFGLVRLSACLCGLPGNPLCLRLLP